MIATLAQLQWLRPEWLWALAALPLLGWWWRRRQASASVWRQTVDAHLLPHLLEQRAVVRRWAAPAIAGLAFILAVLAMAGPSLREIQQPLWTREAPLVVAIDLSSASLAADMPPSRIARARARIGSLLAGRKDGQTGLVAWAGEAFTVAPLTSDAANVALFLDALDPAVMPIDGQRPDRAITWSVQLLAQAGFHDGTILLLTDHATPQALAEAKHAHARGYTVSVLGMGTPAGAPYRNVGGGIVVARLDDASLRQLAAAGGGRYSALSADTADLAALGLLDPRAGGGATADGTVTRRQDDGYWLLLPLMVLALLAFRRGAPVLLLVMCLWLPGRGVHAAELWQRPDQRAHRTMQDGAEAYRRGDFAAAAELYGSLDSAEADYNRGNALAKDGRYAEAVDAYDKALRTTPGMPDAIANRQAVEAAMERQPPSGSNPSSGGNQGRSGQDQSGIGQDGSRPPPGDKDQSEGKSDAGASSDQSGADGQPPDVESRGAADQQDKASDAAGSGKAEEPADNASASDAQAQQAADEAQRERMREALQQDGQGGQDGATPAEAIGMPESAEEREQRIANEAWLRRIPDDPGGLLRRKFQIEYERRQREGSTQ